MPDVHYSDPDTNQPDHVDIPDELYQDQNIEFVEGFTDANDLRNRWISFLQLSGSRALLDAAVQNLQIQQNNPQPNPAGQQAAIVYDNFRVVRVEVVLPDGTTRRTDVIRTQFDLGPTDALGNTDPTFGALDDASKMQRWENHLQSGNFSQADLQVYGSISSALQGQLDTDSCSPAKRCADALRAIPGFRTWPKTKFYGTLLAAGAAVGIWQLVEYLKEQAATPPTPPSPPTNVTATVEWRTGGNSTVTVNWAAGTVVPMTWVVTLTPSTGDATGATVAGSLTTAKFDKVADGAYSVSVVAKNMDASSDTVTIQVTVTDPGVVNPPTGVPPAPTKVTLVATSTPSGRFVTAAWTPDPTAAATDTYTVTLSPVAPTTGTDIVREAGTMTSFMVQPLSDGTYVAKVKTRRGTQASAEVTSNQVAYTRVAASAPNPPVAVAISAYRNATATRPGLVVRWDPPAGDPPSGYVVTFQPPGGVKPTVVDTGFTITSFPDLADGAYSASVVTKGAGVASAPVAVSFTLAAGAVPADTIDWDDVLSGKAVDAWRNVSTTMDSTQEVQFWADVIAAVTDAANNYGGTASLPEQRELARFLSSTITDPPDAANTPSQLMALSGRVAGEGLPPAQQFPLTPGAPWTGDPLFLWKRASTIRTQGGNAYIPVRRRLQAIVTVLDRYLGA